MSVPPEPSGQTPGAEHTVSVDLAAFLPGGVDLAGADGNADAADDRDAPGHVGSASTTTPWRPDVEALDAVEADLDAVDAALESLDDGTYGTCRVCAQPIDDDLLVASPARTTCAAHPGP